MSKGYFCFRILMIIILCVCFSFATSSNSKIDPNIPVSRNEISPEKIARFEREMTESLTQSFVSSMEMKENVEFLLTPALVMQENMSSEILTTYPTE